MIVTPDDNSIIVLRRGNSKGFIGSTPLGGHCAPISTVGDKALWKNVQNISKKNKASLTINKATPIVIPLCTADVWLPIYVASDIISLNQNDIEDINDINEKLSDINPKAKPCIDITADVVNVKRDMLVHNGQGEGETR